MLDKKELEQIKQEILLCEEYLKCLFDLDKQILNEIVNNNVNYINETVNNMDKQLLTEVVKHNTIDIKKESYHDPILDIPRYGTNNVQKFEVFDMEKLNKRLNRE